MDESGYWLAYQKAAEISAAADAERACVFGVNELVSAASSALQQARSALAELRGNPGRRGSAWTRSALNAEIARLEREVRRREIYLGEFRQHEARHEAELQRLAPMRETTGKLIGQMTSDFEALETAKERREAAKEKGE